MSRAETTHEKIGDPVRLRASLLADGDKRIVIVYDEEKYSVLGRLEQSRQDKKSLVPAL